MDAKKEFKNSPFEYELPKEEKGEIIWYIGPDGNTTDTAVKNFDMVMGKLVDKDPLHNTYCVDIDAFAGNDEKPSRCCFMYERLFTIVQEQSTT